LGRWRSRVGEPSVSAIPINIRAVNDQLTSRLNNAKAGVQGFASSTHDSLAAVEAIKKNKQKIPDYGVKVMCTVFDGVLPDVTKVSIPPAAFR
jgi:hypothetical protein